MRWEQLTCKPKLVKYGKGVHQIRYTAYCRCGHSTPIVFFDDDKTMKMLAEMHEEATDGSQASGGPDHSGSQGSG